MDEDKRSYFEFRNEFMQVPAYITDVMNRLSDPVPIKDKRPKSPIVPKPPQWNSAKGPINIKDMEDDHLSNTIRLLEREARAAAKAHGMAEGHWRKFVNSIYHHMYDELTFRRKEED